MIKNVLEHLGFDDKEMAVYLQLLKLGPLRASTIAYQLHLPRTTVQNILIRLEREQMVTKGMERNVYIFAAVHPESLSKIVAMKKRAADTEFDRLGDDLKKVTPELIGMMRSKKVIPNVKFFQGREGVRKVLFDTLTSKTEIKDYANIDAMFQYVRDINDEYVAEREKTNVKKRSLLLDTPFAHQIYESGTYSPKSHAGYKWISSEQYPFSLEMNIYDGKISYITYVEDDFVGVIVKNEHIYHMHESTWRLVWDLLPIPS
ncbi:MAG: helix-turn-helix domain-containing protein [Patescibacteria group bacterium]